MRKNYIKQQPNKIWKASSISLHTDPRSPRFTRQNKVPKNGKQKAKEKQELSENKNQLAISAFKNELRQLKEDANRMLSGEKESGSRKSLRFKSSQSKIPSSEELLSPSSEYLMTRKSVVFNNNQKTLEMRKLTPKSPAQSLAIDKNIQGTRKYYETLRKYTNQNERLKKEIDQLRHNFQQISIEKQEIKLEYQRLRTERKYQSNPLTQTSIIFIESLQNQIAELKQDLMISQREVNAVSIENYRMKKEIYEACIEKDRIQTNFKQLKSRKKLKSPKCPNCTQISQKIGELNDNVQSNILEISKKNTLIDSLCKEIGSLNQKLNNFEKPRHTIKKYSNFIDQLNKEVIEFKILNLNEKYRQE